MSRPIRVVHDPDADAVKFPWHPVLDVPCDAPKVLTALLHEALTTIILTADGSAQALVERVTGSKPGTKAPTSTLAGEVDELSRGFAKCRTNRTRLYVIREAQQQAVRLRYSPRADPRFVRGTAEWRERIARDPRPRRVVAEDYRVSSKTITQARREFAVS